MRFLRQHILLFYGSLTVWFDNPEREILCLNEAGFSFTLNARKSRMSIIKIFRIGWSKVFKIRKFRKEGHRVILEPLDKEKWPDGFWNSFDVDTDFPIIEPTAYKTVLL